MLYVWQAQDATAGRRISSWNRAEKYIIGYDPAEVTKNRRAVISLSDGMIAFKGGTTAQLVDWLNKSKMRPDTVEVADVKEVPLDGEG